MEVLDKLPTAAALAVLLTVLATDVLTAGFGSS